MTRAHTTGREVAIVGLSVRFPGPPALSRWWEDVLEGKELTTRFDRATLRAAGIDPHAIDDDYVAVQGVLSGVEEFDAKFFGLTNADAASMDPQHRLMLECAWEAMRSAAPAARTGVYAGVGFPMYLLRNLSGQNLRDERLAAMLNDKDHVSTRIADRLNCQGPAITVQSACSTGLVAVHLAVQALLAGDADLALAGAMTIRLPQVSGYLPVDGGVDSQDGHCRPFDHHASGMVRGSGGGVIALRLLEDALECGDDIWAVIRGTGVSNDGGNKLAYSAPSAAGQELAVRSAMAVAEVKPSDYHFIECHGTGTQLGDVVEATALTRVFGAAPPITCYFGSVKGNIGHLDTGAGIAGLTKAVLSMRTKALPPTINFDALNPGIDLAHSGLRPATQRIALDTGAGSIIGGVSAFGIGGTNAHVVLESAPPRPIAEQPRRPSLLVVGAHTEESLEASAASLANCIECQPDTFAGIAKSLSGRQSDLPHRLAAVGDAPSVISQLRAARSHMRTPNSPRPVVMVFPGQGDDIVAAAQTASNHLRDFDEILTRFLNRVPEIQPDIRRYLSGTSDAFPQLITQPAHVAVQAVLADAWVAMNIRPTATIGHSLGELAAAYAAGHLDASALMNLAAQRGAAADLAQPGAMVSVPLSAEELRPLLDGTQLDIAVINAPDRAVVSGAEADISDLAEKLRTAGIEPRTLGSTIAFHSRLMDAASHHLGNVASVTNPAPTATLISTLTGTSVTKLTPDHWARQLRERVQFFPAALSALELHPDAIFLEIGCTGKLAPLLALHCEAPTTVGLDRDSGALAAMGNLWELGCSPNWAPVHAGEQRHSLPAYPFGRERHWHGPADPDTTDRHIAEWIYQEEWEPFHSSTSTASPPTRWTVVGPDIEPTVVGSNEGRAGLVYVAADHDAQTPNTALDSYWDLLTTLRPYLDQGIESLIVVTAGAEKVFEADTIRPASAAVAGVSAVAAQEMPGLTACAIDLEPSIPPSERAIRAVNALAPAPPPPRSALRHDTLYVPQLQPRTLPEPAEDPLRDNGTYLIAGGTGGVGRALAPRLATSTRKVILVGRNTHAQHDDATLPLQQPTTHTNKRTPQAADAAQLLEDLAAHCGIQVRAAVSGRTVVDPYSEMLKRLTRITAPPTAASDIRARLLRDYPESATAIALLDHATEHAPAVITGQESGVSALMADPSLLNTATEVMARWSGQADQIDALTAWLKDLALQIPRLKVLEVGSGKGRLTDPVVRALEGTGATMTVSDVAASFVADARRRHASSDLDLRFESIDIAEGDGAAAKYDVAIALNTLHVIADVDAGIGNLRERLKPGGWLAAIETTADDLWTTLIWGLTKDWWNRGATPLQGATAWHQSFEHAGLTASTDTAAGSTLVVGRRPAAPTDLFEIEPNIFVASADLTDPADATRLLDVVRRDHGPIHGVLHLAIDSPGGTLHSQTRSNAAREFGPKAEGLAALGEALSDEHLDFFIVFSTLNALLGGAGASAYAAASIYVDRYCEQRSAEGPHPMLAIDWPLWSGIGTAIHTEASGRWLGPVRERIGMTADQGALILSTLVNSRVAGRVVISPVIPTELVTPGNVSGSPTRSDPAPAAADHRETIRAIWREVFGVAEINDTVHFAEYGGDSLSATQIVAQVRDVLGHRIRVADFLADPTVNGLLAVLTDNPTRDDAAAPPSAAATPSSPSTTTTSDDASSEDLKTLLAHIDELDAEVTHRALVSLNDEEPATGGDEQ